MNRLGAIHRWLIHATSVLLLLSGMLWAVVHYFPGVVGYASDAAALGTASLLMKVHGAVAMGALVLLGTMLTKHVPGGWSVSRNKPSGIATLVVSCVLVLTGYLLYYAGDETRRVVFSDIHLGAGIGFFALLAAHAWWN